MAAVKATTAPTATTAPRIAPVLRTIVRTRCCLAGAIATPAGCEAAIAFTLGASAAAVPTGCCEAAFCGADSLTDLFCVCSSAAMELLSCSEVARTVPGLSGKARVARRSGGGVEGAPDCCAASDIDAVNIPSRTRAAVRLENLLRASMIASQERSRNLFDPRRRKDAGLAESAPIRRQAEQHASWLLRDRGVAASTADPAAYRPAGNHESCEPLPRRCRRLQTADRPSSVRE